MDALLRLVPFALEGQWHGAAAVTLVIVGVLIFVGSVYVLLAAIYGWLQAYLVTMVALMIFSIILAGVWLIGIPGTPPGTGPRGTEPSWVMFLADSEQGIEFRDDINDFPRGAQPTNDWRRPDATEHYPGNISVEGEIDSVKGVLFPALAGYFQRQRTGSSDPQQYQFRIRGREVSEQEEAFDVVDIFFKPNGTVERIHPETEEVLGRSTPRDPASQLLVGIRYPEKRNEDGEVIHPAITVFGYRNKGRVFEASLQWMIASIVLFALHLWWLHRYEIRQRRRRDQLESGTLREPVGV